MKDFIINWTGSSNNPTDYVVEYGISGQSVSTVNTGSGDPVYRLEDLTDREIYQIRIAGINGFGSGDYSAITYKYASQYPSAPLNLASGLPILSGDINLIWDEPEFSETAITDYNVIYTPSGESTVSTTVGGTDTFFDLEDLDATKEHYIVVNAINAEGSGILASGNFYPHPEDSNIIGDPHFSDVVLLTHFDGTNGATTTTDSSNSAHTLTLVNSELSTTSPRYGTTKLIETSSSIPYGGMEVPLSSDFDFGTGDFTVEGYINVSASPSNSWVLAGVWGTTANKWLVRIEPGLALRFYYNGGNITSSGSISTGQWVHIAVTRESGTVRLFIDGTLDGSSTVNDNLDQGGQILTVGNYSPTATQFEFDIFPDNGIDEVRITKGVARYTSNFTAPSQPFPDQEGVGTTTTTTTTTTAAPSANAAALLFDGTTDVPYVAHNSNQNGTNDAITLEAWVYIDSSNNSNVINYIFEKLDGNYGYRLDYFYNDSTSKGDIRFRIGTGTSTQVIGTDAADELLEDTWYHVAGTMQDNEHKLYIDGELKASATGYNMSTNTLSEDIKLGAQTSTGAAAKGSMAFLRITKGIRYTGNFTPSATLSDYESGNDASFSDVALLITTGTDGSTAIVDESNDANTITNIGNTVYDTDNLPTQPTTTTTTTTAAPGGITPVADNQVRFYVPSTESSVSVKAATSTGYYKLTDGTNDSGTAAGSNYYTGTAHHHMYMNSAATLSTLVAGDRTVRLYPTDAAGTYDSSATIHGFTLMDNTSTITAVDLSHCSGIKYADMSTGSITPRKYFGTATSSSQPSGITEIRAEGLKLGTDPQSYSSHPTLTSLNGWYWGGGGADLAGQNLEASELDQLYTDLISDADSTLGTIIVTSNPGTSSDTPSIATGKGYTVEG